MAEVVQCPQCGWSFDGEALRRQICRMCDSALFVASLATLERVQTPAVRKYVAHYTSRLAAIPDDAASALALGICYLHLGLHDHAARALDRMVEAHPAEARGGRTRGRGRRRCRAGRGPAGRRRGWRRAAACRGGGRGRSRSSRRTASGTPLQLTAAEVVELTTSGGTSVSVILRDPTLIKRMGGGQIPTTRAEKAIQTVRKMLRERKA